MRKVALALVALALMACGFGAHGDPGPAPTAADLTVDLTPDLVAGSWRSDDRGATLAFAADGTFRAANVPAEIFAPFARALTPGFDASRDKIDATGTWVLPEKDPGAPARHRNQVKVVFEPGGFIQSRGEVPLEAWWKGSRPSLVIGKVVYLKCDQPCAAPSPSR